MNMVALSPPTMNPFDVG